jgi:ABC-type transport system involved in multi-copper enzyme maturation permease subunit
MTAVVVGGSMAILAIGLHALATRLPPSGASVLKFVGIASIVGVLQVGGLFGIGTSVSTTVASVLVYAFLTELYLFLFTLVSSSVTVSLLLFLSERSANPVGLLVEIADPGEMVERRVEKLTANGLVMRGRPLALTERGRKLLGVFTGLNRFFRHPAGR